MALRLVSEVIALLLFSATVLSKPRVDCYVCGWSANNDTCGDAEFALTPEQNHHYMVNCNICYKKVKIGASGEKMSILRGCSLSEWVYLSKCQSIDYEGGFSEQVCACNSGDYCNNATPTRGGSAAFYILAVSVALAVMRLLI